MKLGARARRKGPRIPSQHSCRRCCVYHHRSLPTESRRPRVIRITLENVAGQGGDELGLSSVPELKRGENETTGDRDGSERLEDNRNDLKIWRHADP